MLALLAHWVNLGPLLTRYNEGDDTVHSLSSGIGQLRELTAAASELSRWRGTAIGLQRFLITATGIPGFAIDEDVTVPNSANRPFHIRITALRSAARHRTLIQRIIEREKPAYVTYELTFDAPPSQAHYETGTGRG